MSELTRTERTVLVLQGGGALGAYQAGAFEALSASPYRPDWVAGISIGAINAALIAGNAPEQRLERLKQFWTLISSPVTPFPLVEEVVETLWNQTAASTTMAFGAPGFFTPRWLRPVMAPFSPAVATSFYDTAPLRDTLLKLVDFDRINSGRTRLSVGAVDVLTGNFTYFDSARMKIGPEHIMASGALPPGFPPVEIDGHYYWDGGLVSNTPLQYILDEDGPDPLLIFQVDLFPARGGLPTTMAEVAEREKDIRFSSRTRHGTDEMINRQKIADAAYNLRMKLPPEWRDDPDMAFLAAQVSPSTKTIVHLIYKSKHTDSFSKDYEFSRASMNGHWAAGKTDVETTFADPRWQNRAPPAKGAIQIFDLSGTDAPPVAARPALPVKQAKAKGIAS